MKLLIQFKAGAKVTPALILIIYYLLIGLDIYTTYLASPDLKYENNWIVRYLKLGWGGLLTKDVIIILFMTTVVVIAYGYLRLNSQNIKSQNKSFLTLVVRNKKYLLSYIVLGTFYSHILFSAFIIINNYLGYIFLYCNENVLFNLSDYYIRIITTGHPNFLKFMQILIPIPGFIFTYFYIKRFILHARNSIPLKI